MMQLHSQKKKIQRWLSISMNKARSYLTNSISFKEKDIESIPSIPNTPTVETPVPASKPYSSNLTIHELTLDKFIICLCDDDLSVLGDDLTQDQRAALWLEIYQEYADAVCSHRDKIQLNDLATVMRLELKITYGVAMMKYLEGQEEWGKPIDPKLIAALKHIGVYIHDQVNWRKLEGFIKKWKIELQVKEKDLQKQEEETKNIKSGNRKTTRDDFQDFLVHLEEQRKVIIKEDETTVGKFISIIKNYNRTVANLEEQAKKMKSK